MATRTRTILIGIIAAITVVGFACGGGGGSDGDGASTILGLEPAAMESGGDGGEEALNASLDYASDDAGQVINATRDSSASAPPSEVSQQTGLLDRKIIQSASLDLEVEEVGRQFQEVIRFAESAGGFVSSSSFSNRDDEQAADLTIRVPATRYQDVLAQIRGLGTVTLESSDANDVTEEYTDLEARLRTLEATEGRYLALLARADTIEDILTVQDRLDGVRGQIEQAQGRINLLDQITELATITVHLRPEEVAAPAEGGGGIQPLAAAASAWDLSLDALRGVAAVTLVVVVFSWWLVPPLLALAFGARWWLNRRPRPPVTEPEPAA